MAGAGYKLFVTGDVLTAAQVNTYLQEQTVMSFADAAARTSALSAVLAEGMMSYLRDTNAVQVYNGSAWVAVGSSSPLTTKGDLYGFSTLDARVPIGTNNQVLTADSTQALGLKWATPSATADSFTLLGTGTLTGAATITVSSISGQNQIYVLVRGASAAASAGIGIRLNGNTGSSYAQYGPYISAGATYNAGNFTALDYTGTRIDMAYLSNNASSVAWGGLLLQGCNGSGKKMFSQIGGADAAGGTGQTLVSSFGLYDSSSTISSVSLFSSSGNFDAGTFEVYGSA
jgi:hypothetical protein